MYCLLDLFCFGFPILCYNAAGVLEIVYSDSTFNYLCDIYGRCVFLIGYQGFCPFVYG